MEIKQLNFTFVGNSDNAVAMAAYMKNKFEFLGLKSGDRKEQSKLFVKKSRQVNIATLQAWIEELYQRTEREYHYLAIDLAEKNVKRWTFADIVTFKQFITQKSWWDSVDHWTSVFGQYIKLHPEQKEKIFTLFFKSSNMWERRVAITLQLKEKDQVDTGMLTAAILFDQFTDEFFIQKAIGWALRQYSKFNPGWVLQFLNEHQLSNLADREGSKYL